MFRNGEQIDFRPRLFVPDVIPKDGRNLRTISADGQKIHAGLGDCRLVQNQGEDGGYDLELQLLLERERRPEELQVTRPQFTWVEVRTQNENQGPNALRARLENELYLPSPAYRLRVWNWPATPGKQNVREAPSKPVVTAWWRDSLPRDPCLIRRDLR